MRGTARAALAGLAVKGRAPRTGYDRDRFGAGWVDIDHNSCTTREDILRRDLRPVTLAGTGGCGVVAGILLDPYTGRRLVYSTDTGSTIDVDHIVALSDAWQKGAQQWTDEERTRFANDPLELVATDASANRAKGDGDAASWLPPRKAYRCSYVARQISVKARYGLWVTAAEQAAMDRVMSRCPDQPTITGQAAPPSDDPYQEESPSPDQRLEPPSPSPDQQSRPESPSSGAGATSYANCDAVRTAGAAPIRRGEPGYSRRLDRDGDGVGCETP